VFPRVWYDEEEVKAKLEPVIKAVPVLSTKVKKPVSNEATPDKQAAQ
jgi:hypothetical protein